MPPGSEFSFHASNYTIPETIEVAVKKITTPVEVENRQSFLIVRGRLPESLSNTFARISIKGTAQLGCKHKGGWLVKIVAPEAAAKQAESPEAPLQGPETNTSKERPMETMHPDAGSTAGN